MKREKRRLVLSGTDDAYAKREAAKEEAPVERPAAAGDEARHAAPEGQVQSPDPESQTKGPLPAPHVEPETQTLKIGEKIQVNYRLNLGEELSRRLQHLAKAHGQPIDLVLKGLRNKAADRFKELASGDTKPQIPEPALGGLSVRYAATLASDLAQSLNGWFDPFGLGVAKEACKPILVGLFQEEAKALCEAAEREFPNHLRI